MWFPLFGPLLCRQYYHGLSYEMWLANSVPSRSRDPKNLKSKCENLNGKRQNSTWKFKIEFRFLLRTGTHPQQAVPHFCDHRLTNDGTPLFLVHEFAWHRHCTK
jgi:hypothetical protein